MKFALATILCLLASAAVAQVVGDGMGSPYGGSKTAVTYTGPGDVVSGATAWYGLRAYSSAQIGGTQKAVNLRRASDNTTCDFDINTSGNLGGTDSGCGTGTGLSLAAFATQDATCTGTIASTTMTCASASSTPHAGSTLTGVGITQPSYIVSCGTFTGGAGACTLNTAQTVGVGETITMTYGLYVTEWYDQSGNNYHASQATAAQQPQLLPLCLGSATTLPCVSFVSASLQWLRETLFTTSISQPYSVSAVAERISAFTTGQSIISNFSGSGIDFNFFTTSTTFRMFAGSVGSFNITAGAVLHAIEGVYNGASSIGYADGSSTTVNPGSGATGTNPYNIGSQDSNICGSASCLSGYEGEVGLWSSGFTLTQAGNVYNNQKSYWNTQ